MNFLVNMLLYMWKWLDWHRRGFEFESQCIQFEWWTSNCWKI